MASRRTLWRWIFVVQTFCAGVGAAPTHKNESTPNDLPIVDLGYQKQQATLFDDVNHFYNFSNIRYAAPPLGDLRFRAPDYPAIDRSSINNGSVGRICPSAYPFWQGEAAEFVGQLLFNTSITLTPPAPDPRTTEDCLFLDVVVPEEVFKTAKHGKRAPVLVWIYGGGFTAGDKSESIAAGLLRRSENGIIFVALNYRLGAFGWLSGPTLQQDGTANAALHDQRFALQWVREHISKFGGDPEAVTVMGESAGGASIMHQITAYGGKYSGKYGAEHKGAPFQRAIVQSPGFLPIYTNDQQEKTFSDFLEAANVSSIEEARDLSTEALQIANLKVVNASVYGSFTFGPAVDGNFVPELAGVLLANGKFDQTVGVMVGHNADEGLDFVNPRDVDNTYFREDIRTVIPTVSNSSLNYLSDVLYPQTYTGLYGYTNPLERAVVAAGELGIVCNTYYLDTGFKNQTYAYRFSIPPALHGDDVYYTFYDNEPPVATYPGVYSIEAAFALQDWIVSFTKTGIPTSAVVPNAVTFPKYGSNATILNIGFNAQTGGADITIQRDDAANPRCAWWQQAFYR